MPTRYDTDDDDLQDGRAGDREISLGTGTVLAIFLALALVCSLFFGLGYSMGRKSTPPAPVIAAAAPSSMSTSQGEKPAPGTLTSPESNSAASTQKSDLQIVQPLEEGSAKDPASSPGSSKAGSHDRSLAAARPPQESQDSVPTAIPAAVIPGAPATYVQIAAVSRKEDADLLLAALKHRGYTGLVRQQAQDKLLHIQVGPFPSKKDAETMRQRLITDGYNPIIK